MRLCRRRSYLLLGLLAACFVSVYLCFLSASLLPREQNERVPMEPHRAREVVMNGQREILNIDHQLPVMVASVSNSGTYSRYSLARNVYAVGGVLKFISSWIIWC